MGARCPCECCPSNSKPKVITLPLNKEVPDLNRSMPVTETDLGPTQGPPLAVFFRFTIPSTLSLLAISTASVVDGFFVGRFLGADALAAINLLMPYFALIFGVALMMAVGGSVKASIAIGKGEYRLASAIFSQIFYGVLLFNLLVIALSLIFSDGLFSLLGAPPTLFPLMAAYFNILALALVIQLSSLVLYYFFRADNQPSLVMRALLLGAATNIVLDALFIYGFKWGIQSAALATLVAQLVQFTVMLHYFRLPERKLRLEQPRWNLLQIRESAFNGLSECINEVSIGLVVLVFHWLISLHSGIQGIAAFSAINYLIFISLMIYYGIVDAMHALLGQNFGCGNRPRINAFMRYAALCIGTLSLLQVIALHIFQEPLVQLFLEDKATKAKEITALYIQVIWPLFLLNGFNVLVCAYLTAAEKAWHSACLAMLRSLILPILFALALNTFFKGHTYIYALPLAEFITFIVAVIFFLHFNPKKLLA